MNKKISCIEEKHGFSSLWQSLRFITKLAISPMSMSLSPIGISLPGKSGFMNKDLIIEQYIKRIAELTALVQQLTESNAAMTETIGERIIVTDAVNVKSAI